VIGPEVPLDGWRLEVIDERVVYDVRITRGDRSRGEHLFTAAVTLPDPSDARYQSTHRGGSYEPVRALGELLGDVVAQGYYAYLLKPGDVPRFELVAAAQAEARRVLEAALAGKAPPR